MPEICPASALIGGPCPSAHQAPEITPDEALDRLATLGVDPDTVTIARADTYRSEGWAIQCSLPKGPHSMQRNHPGTYDSGVAPLLRQALARIEAMIGTSTTEARRH